MATLSADATRARRSQSPLRHASTASITVACGDGGSTGVPSTGIRRCTKEARSMEKVWRNSGSQFPSVESGFLIWVCRLIRIKLPSTSMSAHGPQKPSSLSSGPARIARSEPGIEMDSNSAMFLAPAASRPSRKLAMVRPLRTDIRPHRRSFVGQISAP